jgi:hypothetical protein
LAANEKSEKALAAERNSSGGNSEERKEIV